MNAVTTLVPMLALALSGTAMPTQSLPATTVTQAVQAQLLAQLQAAGSRASIRVLGRVPDVRVPVGTVDVVVGAVAGRWPRARAAVPVQVQVDHRAVRALTLWIGAEDLQSVAVYAQSYPARAPADAITRTQGTVDRVKFDGTLAQPDAIAHARLRHAVSAGQPVLAADFESMPAVLANQPVTIEVEHGPVHLHTRGVALADGRVGDTVDVRPAQSSQIVTSRVTGNQQVLVHD
jgi:flagella basal body P-ring formation protein FlgA